LHPQFIGNNEGVWPRLTHDVLLGASVFDVPVACEEALHWDIRGLCGR
jgi:hypothetical protein